MIEYIGAAVGALFIFSKIVGLIKSFLFVEQNIKKLADRPVSDREATIFDHVLSEHREPLKLCQTSACAGLS